MKASLFDFFALGTVVIIAAAQLYQIAKTQARVKTFGLLPFWVTYVFWAIFVIVPMVVLTLLAIFRR